MKRHYRLFHRPEPDPFQPQERFGGLSQVQVNELATYNAERARGLLHSVRWGRQMAELQDRFNRRES